MRHTQNVQANIATATKVLGLATRTFAEFALQAEAMSRVPHAAHLPGGLFDQFIDETTSELVIAGQIVSSVSLRDGSIMRAIDAEKNRDLRVNWERQRDRAESNRAKLFDELMSRYESDRCQLSAPGTLWAGFNAITEMIDHGQILRYNGSELSRKESRFQSLVYGKGDGWKQIALQVAMGLAS
jgi:hypothetical protein